jgi:hypothetical protein
VVTVFRAPFEVPEVRASLVAVMVYGHLHALVLRGRELTLLLRK